MPTCPRCGDEGDVHVDGPGRASCAVCGGGFLPMQRVIDSLVDAGVSPIQLKEIVARDGQRVRPCPSCQGMLTTFPVRRELLHSCAPCAGIWLDASARALLGGAPLPSAPSLDLVPTPAPPSVMTAGGLELQRAPRARGSAAVGDERDAIRSMRSGLGDLPIGGPAAADAPPKIEPAIVSFASPAAVSRDEQAMFRPAAGGPAMSSDSKALWLGRGLKLAMALGVIALFYVIWNTAHDKGHRAVVGGGYGVTFWSRPIAQSTVPIDGGFSATRFVSPWGTNVLEAAFVPGAGGTSGELSKNGRPEAILTTLYGQWIKITNGPSVLDNGLVAYDADFIIDTKGTTTHTIGWARVEFNQTDAFVMAAYSDGNVFAKSGKANAFMTTLKKLPVKSNGDGAKAAAGLAPDVD